MAPHRGREERAEYAAFWRPWRVADVGKAFVDPPAVFGEEFHEGPPHGAGSVSACAVEIEKKGWHVRSGRSRWSWTGSRDRLDGLPQVAAASSPPSGKRWTCSIPNPGLAALRAASVEAELRGLVGQKEVLVTRRGRRLVAVTRREGPPERHRAIANLIMVCRFRRTGDTDMDGKVDPRSGKSLDPG